MSGDEMRTSSQVSSTKIYLGIGQKKSRKTKYKYLGEIYTNFLNNNCGLNTTHIPLALGTTHFGF